MIRGRIKYGVPIFSKFSGSTLTNGIFNGAIVNAADFSSTTSSGFTSGQLYSTASYGSGDLTGIRLSGNDLTGWIFANQNLTNAQFQSSGLTSANFTNANLVGASFTSSTLTNTNFADADLRGASDWSPDATTITHNTIRPDGSIQGLALLAGEKLIVRNNPIAVTVTTSATFDSASTLQLVLDHNWTSTIQFAAGLSPSLNGTLDFEFAGGFVPVAGDKFTLMTYSATTSGFSAVTGATPAAGLSYTPVYLPTSLVVITTVNGTKTWLADSDGNASLGSNWLGGVAPGGIGDSVAFTTIVSAPRTVTINTPITVGTVKFDSPYNYTIGGTSALTLQAAGSTPAAIDVQNTHGNSAHTISAPLTLASNLNIAQNSGGALTLSGTLNDAAGNTITTSGTGTTAITGSINLGNAASLAVNSGTLQFNIASGTTTIGSGVTATVATGATLQLAGSVSALANANGSNAASITTNGTELSTDGALMVTGTTSQTVGIVSGVALPGTGTTYSGNTTVGDGVNVANLTATQILQNTLTINAGSSVTIAPSTGSQGGAIATVSIAAPPAPTDSRADASVDSNSELFTYIETGISSGLISNVTGRRIENRIIAVEHLASKPPGLDINLLEDRVLASIPPTSLLSATDNSPLTGIGSGLLTLDSSTLASSSSCASAAFASGLGVVGNPASVPELSTILLLVLGAIVTLPLARRRNRGP